MNHLQPVQRGSGDFLECPRCGNTQYKDDQVCLSCGYDATSDEGPDFVALLNGIADEDGVAPSEPTNPRYPNISSESILKAGVPLVSSLSEAVNTAEIIPLVDDDDDATTTTTTTTTTAAAADEDDDDEVEVDVAALNRMLVEMGVEPISAVERLMPSDDPGNLHKEETAPPTTENIFLDEDELPGKVQIDGILQNDRPIDDGSQRKTPTEGVSQNDRPIDDGSQRKTPTEGVSQNNKSIDDELHHERPQTDADEKYATEAAQPKGTPTKVERKNKRWNKPLFMKSDPHTTVHFPKRSQAIHFFSGLAAAVSMAFSAFVGPLFPKKKLYLSEKVKTRFFWGTAVFVLLVVVAGILLAVLTMRQNFLGNTQEAHNSDKTSGEQAPYHAWTPTPDSLPEALTIQIAD